MHDPFPIAPQPWLSAWVLPLAQRFDFPTLPLHVHEIVAAALLYFVIFWPLSPLLSNWLAPGHYPKLSRRSRLNWDAHVVSMVQSVLINIVALAVIIFDDERRHMDRQERIWGYTGACAMVQALAAGYFVWDFIVTSIHFDVFGPGTLAHAVAALVVYSLGFRPFLNYYSSVFILWELSTPFLNVHWFMDKMQMTGSRAQLYNGLLLLFTFFSSRLVYGTYQSYTVMCDIFAVVNTQPALDKLSSPTMEYASSHSTVPLWLGAAYLLSNLTLNFLNFYWFYKMIYAVRKRFQPGKEHVTEAQIDTASIAVSGASLTDTPVRRRKA